MTRAKWRFLLPATMLSLALACHVYDPHEYRVKALSDGATSNLFYFGQHSPAWSGRISKGVSFPALVLAYPFRDTRTVYERGDVDHILILITGEDVAFFIGILFLWSGVGWLIDQRGLPVARSQVMTVGRVGGLIFGLLTGGYAARMIVSEWFPERVIASFGIAWAALLIAYFALRLIRGAKAGRDRNTAG